MNFEDRLERHFEAASDAIPEREGDVAAIAARGRRRRTVRRIATATSAAAIVLLAVGITASLLTGTTDDSEVIDGTTTTTAQTTTSTTVGVDTVTLDDALVVATDEGLVVTDGSRQVAVPGDLYYERIGSVISDGVGGLLMVHEITPLPWGQGDIVRLAAGATRPDPVVPGPSDPTTARTLVGRGIDGFVYADRAVPSPDLVRLDVFSAGVDGSSPRRILTLEQAGGSTEILGAVTASSDLVAVVFTEDFACSTVHLYASDGSERGVIGTDCEFGPIDDVTISPDGGTLIVLSSPPTSDGRMAQVVDVGTGVVSAGFSVEAWAVGWRSPTEVVVTTATGVGVLDLEAGTVESATVGGTVGVAVAADRVTLADGATTGSGSGLLPCDTGTVASSADTSWTDGAPPAVVDTWSELRRLAEDCDLQALSDLASGNGTSFTFGGTDDLARLWVRSARLGHSYRNDLLAVTALAPATSQSEQGMLWVWPAVFSTDAERDWQMLVAAGVLTSDDVRSMKEFGGYIGYRVGITEDGTWAFGIAGD